MRVFLYTIFSFWRYIFRIDFNSKLVWEDLLFKFSYRYNEKDKRSFKMFFVFLKQALQLLYAKSDKSVIGNTTHLIFDIGSGDEKGRIDYIMPFIKTESFYFQAKQELRFNGGILKKLMYTFLTLLVFLFTVILSLFYSNKANLALLIREFVELLILSDLVKRLQIKNMFFFSAYEKDTCYISDYLIQKRNVTVQLIPSPNPISNFYRNVICTTFTFTVSYQKCEYEKLKKNWIISDTMVWPPAGYASILKTTKRQTSHKTIAFISSGNWLRKKLGHNDLGKGVFKAEDTIIDCLKHYLNIHSDVKLFISLHPIEKKRLDETIKFYESIFAKSSFEFSPFDKLTREVPEMFDVAIATYSSALFERLFAGYKVMFSQDGMPENYFNDERLQKITANNKDDFEVVLNDILQLSNNEYFEKYDLVEYSHKHFQSYPAFNNE